ncbi:hypothetical protein Cni_G07226 [Canna indica]|uniref:BHLH domain-containing protein n=1 Tax=Canna indica TaxID=4628 RepID=A0AAQ3Q7C2_9LILI|nr:hypothetical protein Cni_G07226 [Canna indica]
MMGGCGGGDVKLERKTVEKNRRIHMKNLCSKLTSLIPLSKRAVTQQDLFDQAFCYISELKERVEKLNQKKLEMTRGVVMIAATANRSQVEPPHITIRSMGSNMEVNLVCGSRTRNLMLREVINVLEEEGAEIVNASFNSLGDMSFHTIHCQAISPRIGVDSLRVHARLKGLVH